MRGKVGGMVLTSAGATINWTEVTYYQPANPTKAAATAAIKFWHVL